MSLVSDKLHFFSQIMTSKKCSFPQNILFNPKQTFAAKFCQIDPNVLNQKFCFVQIEFSPTKWLHQGVSVGWSAGWSVYRMVHRFKSDSQNLSNIFFWNIVHFLPKNQLFQWNCTIFPSMLFHPICPNCSILTKTLFCQNCGSFPELYTAQNTSVHPRCAFFFQHNFFDPNISFPIERVCCLWFVYLSKYQKWIIHKNHRAD